MYLGSFWTLIRHLFDTVDHKILLGKLHHNGNEDQPIDSFNSYLYNHKQFILVNAISSGLATVSHVVLQTSILGPYLFLLCIQMTVNCTDKKKHNEIIYR